jgi:serine/threonine protein kinase
MKESIEESLFSEIILLKNIDHNNIIKYYGYSVDNNNDFFIVIGNF